jgi:hypothetical protein
LPSWFALLHSKISSRSLSCVDFLLFVYETLFVRFVTMNFLSLVFPPMSKGCFRPCVAISAECRVLFIVGEVIGGNLDYSFLEVLRPPDWLMIEKLGSFSKSLAYKLMLRQFASRGDFPAVRLLRLLASLCFSSRMC